MPKSARTFRAGGVSQRAQIRQRGRRYDQQRGSSAKRGYGGRWQRTREGFLKRHPVCVCCETKGKAEPATVVDHIVPHHGDNDLFWQRSNWQALCKRCHDVDKQRIEAKWKSGQATIEELSLGNNS